MKGDLAATEAPALSWSETLAGRWFSHFSGRWTSVVCGDIRWIRVE
jgi:hypothetical protein